jgi:hypothetical protein
MNDQELKKLWQEQKLENGPAMAPDEQIAAMRKKMEQLHRRLNVRDFRELAAGVVVIVVFAIYFVIFPYLVARIGVLIVIGGMLFALWWMVIRSRRSVPQPIADAPVAEWLKYELAKVQQQAELLRTVFWWYLLPPYIGVNAFVWGLPNGPLAFNSAFTVFSALLYTWIYWLNQRARRKQLLPLQRELESLLQAERSEKK